MEQYQQGQPQTVLNSKQSIYVDNVIGREDNVGSTKLFKWNVIKNFHETALKFHKWHSNITELEINKDHSQIESDKTYAKK